MADVFGEMDADIRARLEAAGLIIGREQEGLMLSIEPGGRCVWYDLAWTTRIARDASDHGDESFLDVVKIVCVPGAEQRMELASQHDAHDPMSGLICNWIGAVKKLPFRQTDHSLRGRRDSTGCATSIVMPR
jgi:hypothetical protein